MLDFRGKRYVAGLLLLIQTKLLQLIGNFLHVVPKVLDARYLGYVWNDRVALPSVVWLKFGVVCVEVVVLALVHVARVHLRVYIVWRILLGFINSGYVWGTVRYLQVQPLVIVLDFHQLLIRVSYDAIHLLLVRLQYLYVVLLFFHLLFHLCKILRQNINLLFPFLLKEVLRERLLLMVCL